MAAACSHVHLIEIEKDRGLICFHCENTLEISQLDPGLYYYIETAADADDYRSRAYIDTRQQRTIEIVDKYLRKELIK